MEEIWRDVECPGFPNYKVSNLGKVLNTNTGNFLSGALANRSHRQVLLRNQAGKKRFKYIHRLVKDAFHPKKQFFFDRVDHADRNPENNNLSNLRWSNVVLNSLNNDCENIRQVGNRYRVSLSLLGRRLSKSFLARGEAESWRDVEKKHLFDKTALLYKVLERSLTN